MFHKRKYKPLNYKKYVGDHTNIIYRSSWEVKLMGWLDNNPDIISWGSEELIIPYKSPVDGRWHRYFPDFVVKMRLKDGKVMTYVIEVKPEHQTKQPVRKRKTQKFINEQVTYIINQSKWKAADEFCHEHGWKFVVVTEKELGLY